MRWSFVFIAAALLLVGCTSNSEPSGTSGSPPSPSSPTAQKNFTLKGKAR